jgi:hypothetical protein
MALPLEPSGAVVPSAKTTHSDTVMCPIPADRCAIVNMVSYFFGRDAGGTILFKR